VDPEFVSQGACSVNDRRMPAGPLRTDRARCGGIATLTKEALSVMALLSSLGLWAAVWAAAASLATAWLQ
jgi:hypothetical protein